MNATRLLSFARPLSVAAVGCAALAAQAAPGFRVTQDQEAQVQTGMSMQQVRDALGRPTLSAQYGNEPGKTFTYRSAGDSETVFEVDFDANGRVLSTDERSGEVAGGNLLQNGR